MLLLLQALSFPCFDLLDDNKYGRWLTTLLFRQVESGPITLAPTACSIQRPPSINQLDRYGFSFDQGNRIVYESPCCDHHLIIYNALYLHIFMYMYMYTGSLTIVGRPIASLEHYLTIESIIERSWHESMRVDGFSPCGAPRQLLWRLSGDPSLQARHSLRLCLHLHPRIIGGCFMSQEAYKTLRSVPPSIW